MQNKSNNAIKKVLLAIVLLGMLPSFFYTVFREETEDGGLFSYNSSSVKGDMRDKRRCLLLSSFRSGSTFLGSALSKNHFTFHVYEPFRDASFLYRQLPNIAELHVKLLQYYMNCDFRFAELVYRNRIKYAFPYFQWLGMKKSDGINLDLVTKMCQRFRYQVIKTVRFRGKFLKTLLADNSVDVKVVMLIRDPRGSYSSRLGSNFCYSPRCRNVTLMCQELAEDYVYSRMMQKKYPGKIMIVHFEDVAPNLFRYIKQIMNFCGLPFSNETKEFIDGHKETHREDFNGPLVPTRDVPFLWKEELPYSLIKVIQDKCKSAMILWRYKKFTKKQYQIHNQGLNQKFNKFV